MVGSLARSMTLRGATLLVFVLALAARLLVVVRSGGFLGSYGYDAGVYYAGGDALLHGLVPYRDFVFLHPPVVLLATAPFAALGRLSSDHVGYVAATIGFQVIGAIDAALVVVVARRFGADRRAATVGGIFYALWLATVSSEYLVRLEPLGNLFLLLALAADARPGRHPGRAALAAGALLGLGCSVKIWFAVPLVLVLVHLARRDGVRTAATALAGAALALVAVDGPFALLAGSSMWSRVVVDQLGRSPIAGSPLYRLGYLTGVARLWTSAATGVRALAVSAAVAALLVVAVRAWGQRAFRPVVVLAAVHLLVLLLAPSFFGFYADFAAVPVALVVAGAAVSRPGRVGAWAAAAPAAVCAALTVAALVTGSFRPVVQWRAQRQLAAAVASARCVSSDAPEGLIELDVLDRNFAQGCPDWVDVTGRTYFGADHSTVRRRLNLQWQRDVRAYLARGSRVFLVRENGTGLAPATVRALSAKLLRVDGDGDAAVVGAARR